MCVYEYRRVVVRNQRERLNFNPQTILQANSFYDILLVKKILLKLASHRSLFPPPTIGYYR